MSSVCFLSSSMSGGRRRDGGKRQGQGQPHCPPQAGQCLSQLHDSPTPPPRYTPPLPHCPAPRSQVGASPRQRGTAGHAIPQPLPWRPDGDQHPDTRSAPAHDPVSGYRPPSRRLLAPRPRPQPGPPPPTAPRRAPALPPGLDLPLRVQRSQARATRATTPPGMHLRPPRTAACHSHGHPRGSPSAAQPPAPQGGRDSAAWVCRFPSCVGCAGRDRCARGRAGVAGVAAVAARDPARPRRSARARPRASGADLEPKPQRRPAQGP